MKIILILVLAAFTSLFLSCGNINSTEKQHKINTDSLHQILKTKATNAAYDNAEYTIFRETFGDLDNDQIDERFVIYKSVDNYMFYLVVFKKIDNTWHVWFKNDKKSFADVQIFEVKNATLIFQFTAPHNIIKDEYALINNELVLVALNIDSKYKCSSMQLNYNLQTEDFTHKSSSGCDRPYVMNESGKKKKEEHVTFENRRFLGHVWRTPKGQLLEF